MRIPVRAAMAAGILAAVLTPAAAAQAAPRPVTVKLGTYGHDRAGVIAAAGRAAGLWTRARVHGDALIITYTPRSRAFAIERTVYTAAFNEVADASGECAAVGRDGVSRRVWLSFRCRTGFVASYTLLVR
jgi:hypothetical protein